MEKFSPDLADRERWLVINKLDLLDEDVLAILPDGQQFKIISESGTDLTCKALIVATGTARNKLGVPGEKDFLGRGVSYCVECDANFFKDGW